MVRAILICSERECTAIFEAHGPLGEIEALACECGCALQVVGWPEPVEGDDGRADLELIAA